MKKGLITLFLLLALVISLPALAADAPALPKDVDTFLSTLPDGFMAISVNGLKQKIDMGEKFFLLDVREPGEFASGHIQGAVNIPIRQLGKNMDKLPADKKAPIIIYCRSGMRCGMVMTALGMAGYTNIKGLAFGIALWELAGIPVQKTTK